MIICIILYLKRQKIFTRCYKIIINNNQMQFSNILYFLCGIPAPHVYHETESYVSQSQNSFLTSCSCNFAYIAICVICVVRSTTRVRDGGRYFTFWLKWWIWIQLRKPTWHHGIHKHYNNSQKTIILLYNFDLYIHWFLCIF